jgi:hypothetical protein
VIECPNCGITFSPRRTACPKCDAFETPRDARLAYWKANAEDRLHEGAPAEVVRADLIEQGFSDVQADEIIGATLSSVKGENRRFGLLRLMAGIVMTVFGALAVGFALMTFRRDAPVRLGGGALGLMIAGGAVMFGAGLLACLSGAFAALTGKESGIGPPTEQDFLEE